MPMTKSEISRYLAEKVGITKKQSDAYLEALAQLAYQEAKNTFIIPGIGKLSLKETPAREAVMPFGPRKGEKYIIPAKKKLRFTIAKAAKDAITGAAETASPTAAAETSGGETGSSETGGSEMSGAESGGAGTGESVA